MANQERMFRVLVISISLKNNQIANSKDEVAESLFSAPIADLIKGGYIEEVSYDSKESDDEAAKLQEEQAKIEADKKAKEEAAKLEEEEAKKAEADKVNSPKTDESDKKGETVNLGDIVNSIPGANAKENSAKK